MIRRQRRARKGGALKIRPSGFMAPCIYDKKFPVGTQFLFETLMFTTEEDENLELQVRGPPPRRWAPIHGGAPCYPASPSTTTSASDGVRIGLNLYAGSYTLTAMTSWGHPMGVPAFWSSGGTLSPTSSCTSIDWDSTNDYPEIGGGVCWNHAIEAR
jgi:hypothetical protein